MTPPGAGMKFAMYVADPVAPGGTIYLRSNPSRLTVIEELTHMGHDRHGGWKRPFIGDEGELFQEEFVTKSQMLKKESIQWTYEEKAILTEAAKYYEAKLVAWTQDKFNSLW
jgi:hypothetical protein